MRRYSQLVILLSAILTSCTFKVSSYLYPTEEQMTFTWRFKSYNSDEIQRGMSKVSFYVSTNEGSKIYYVAEKENFGRGNGAYISSDYFLNSAMIFRNDSILLAPFSTLNDAKHLTVSDFTFFIPKYVNQQDTIRIIDGEKSILLFGFSKVNLTLNGITFKKCLHIKVIEKWEKGSLYQGEVWLDKKYGLVKWIRSTGRVEERVLKAVKDSLVISHLKKW